MQKNSKSKTRPILKRTMAKLAKQLWQLWKRSGSKKPNWHTRLSISSRMWKNHPRKRWSGSCGIRLLTSKPWSNGSQHPSKIQASLLRHVTKSSTYKGRRRSQSRPQPSTYLEMFNWRRIKASLKWLMHQLEEKSFRYTYRLVLLQWTNPWSNLTKSSLSILHKWRKPK